MFLVTLIYAMKELTKKKKQVPPQVTMGITTSVPPVHVTTPLPVLAQLLPHSSLATATNRKFTDQARASRLIHLTGAHTGADTTRGRGEGTRMNTVTGTVMGRVKANMQGNNDTRRGSTTGMHMEVTTHTRALKSFENALVTCSGTL